MSSKLVKGGGLQADSIVWRLAGSALPPFSHDFVPSSDNRQSDEKGQIDLELRLRSMEREVDHRCEEAFQRGLQQGTHQGDSTARQQLSGETEAMVQRMARTIEEISGLRQRGRREAEGDIVSLALAIARRILHRELTIDPEAILGLVKASLDKLDVRELRTIRVHPENASQLEKHFERMGLPRRLAVTGDSSLERGAAILETDRGSVDASVETQLAEIERGFTDLVRHAK